MGAALYADGVKVKNANPHEHHRDRMRKKILNGGFDNFEDHEALEVLLYYCVPRRNTNELASRLIKEFGSLYNLLDANAQEIARRGGISIRSAMLITLIVPIYKKYALSKNAPRRSFENTDVVGRYAVDLLNNEPNECFYLICLDTQKKNICSERIAKGTIDGATFYTRQMVETAIKYHAKFVVIAHNHPSGRLEPSNEDIDATKSVVNALFPIGIEVLDHIIVGGGGYCSFFETGLI